VRVVAFGEACLHVTARVAPHNVAAGRFVAGDVVVSPGGSAVVFAQQVAALGHECRLHAVFGDDPVGRFVAERLAAAGLGDPPVAVPGGQTARLLIAVGNGGDHEVVADGGVGGLSFIAQRAGAAASADTVYVPAFPGSERLLEALSRRRASLACDFGFRPWLDDPATAEREIVARLHGVRTAVLSAAGMDEGAAQALVERCLAAGVETVALTMGARGALVATRDERSRRPPPDTVAANTIGAGDAFAAGLVVALGEGRSVSDAAAFAQAVAAASVGRLDGPAPRADAERLLGRA
jgi:ribokinase